MGSRDDHVASSMLEIVLTTMESKLRRVENLDRAVQHLMRKIDGLEEIIESKAESVIQRIETSEQASIARHEDTTKKIEYLTKKFDSVCDEDVEEVEEFVALPSVRRSRILAFDPHHQRLFQTSTGAGGSSGSGGYGQYINPHQRSREFGSRSSDDASAVKKAVKDIRSTVSGMDRRLAFHINIVSENLGKMASMVEDVHEAVFEDDEEEAAGAKSGDIEAQESRHHHHHTLSSGSRLRSNLERQGRNVSSFTKRKSKLDSLIFSLHPLSEVKDRMDEFRGMLMWTKNTVDGLVPNTEQLLAHSLEQDKAILNIHNDLNEKTNAIIQEIGQVEKELSDTKENIALAEKATQLLLQPEDLDSSGSAAAYVTTTAFLTTDNSLNNVTFPHDVDAVTSSAVSPVINNQFFNPDEREPETSTTRQPTRGPSVIFPSIENKPIVVNNSFTYDTGKNSHGITGYSCADLQGKGLEENGIYYLQIDGTRFWYLKVYCDMKAAEGGWTVIQRRGDYRGPRQSFNKDWEEYKYGFGDPDREFWLGNENIYMLTRSDDYELRIQLEDFEGNHRYAEYNTFRLGSEKENYRLEIGGYQGNAGDSLNDPWYGSNLRPFSTHDSDNDRSSLNCASMLKGGWWWKSCGRGLNGLYLTDPQDLTARQGIVWFRWRGWDYTLKSSQMMIRPKSFRQTEEGERNHGESTSIHKKSR